MNEAQKSAPISRTEEAVIRILGPMKNDADVDVREQARNLENLIRNKAIKICELASQQYDKSGKPINHVTLGFDQGTARVVAINVPRGFVESPDMKSWGVIRAQIRDYVGIIARRNM